MTYTKANITGYCGSPRASFHELTTDSDQMVKVTDAPDTFPTSIIGAGDCQFSQRDWLLKITILEGSVVKTVFSSRCTPWASATGGIRTYAFEGPFCWMVAGWGPRRLLVGFYYGAWGTGNPWAV